MKVSELLAQVPDVADHETLRLLLLAADEGALWTVGDPDVTAEVAGRFQTYVERRRGGEPLQYIEETVHFGPLELRIDSRALIPRPETERLWELAVDLVKGVDHPMIVDLCTGSGNLALALKWARPDSAVIGCDLSYDALDLARENAALVDLAVDFLFGDLLDPLPPTLCGKVDLIVSNPPYVARSEYKGLAAEVREHEPMEALVADSDGLGILSRIAVEAADWLRPGAAIVCEIGETQGLACLDLFAAYSPRIEKDLTGRDRFVVGSAPMASDVH